MLADLFGAIVRTAVNVVAFPIDVARDICTLGGELVGEESATKAKVRKLKDEATTSPVVRCGRCGYPLMRSGVCVSCWPERKK